MQKRQYDNKCKNFFEKASQMEVGLEFDPEQFDANRLNCTWIGGRYAYIISTVVKSQVSRLILASSMTIFSMTISWSRLIKFSMVYLK